MSEKKQVLIVDDEESIRQLFSDLVESMGYEAIVANDGREAFQLATSTAFDLILLDIMMPDWNGVDAIKSLDFIEKNPKVLVISGYISDNLKKELDELKNISGFVDKPFDVVKLQETIHNLVEGS